MNNDFQSSLGILRPSATYKIIKGTSVKSREKTVALKPSNFIIFPIPKANNNSNNINKVIIMKIILI